MFTQSFIIENAKIRNYLTQTTAVESALVGTDLEIVVEQLMKLTDIQRGISAYIRAFNQRVEDRKMGLEEHLLLKQLRLASTRVHSVGVHISYLYEQLKQEYLQSN
jgi:hypothetical protein